jgi:hypothetical protein
VLVSLMKSVHSPTIYRLLIFTNLFNLCVMIICFCFQTFKPVICKSMMTSIMYITIIIYIHFSCPVKKGKATHVTGREGSWGCEIPRVPHSLNNRLTDGGKIISLTLRPSFTPRKIPGTHFY